MRSGLAIAAYAASMITIVCTIKVVSLHIRHHTRHVGHIGLWPLRLLIEVIGCIEGVKHLVFIFLLLLNPVNGVLQLLVRLSLLKDTIELHIGLLSYHCSKLFSLGL